MPGVGTHVGFIVKRWLQIETGGCGGCRQLLEEMDSNGPAWCRANLGTIVPRIRANARRNPKWRARILARLPGAQRPILAMVRLAISRAEADLQKEHQHGS